MEVVRRSFEAFNARDIDELVTLFAEDCELLPFRAQLEGNVYRGHEGLRRFAREGDEDWKAYRIDPVEFHDRGDRVAVIGRLRALGHASSVEIDSNAGFVFELHRGRISVLISHSDPEAALKALRLRA